MSRFQNILPFLAVAIGIGIFSLMDAIMKKASLDVGVYTALLLRSGIGAALVFPFWKAAGGLWPRGKALRIHALRSAVVAGMASLFFWGLMHMPIAEGIALSFISPLIALYLAAVLLKETIHKSAIIASLLGLIGVSIIVVARLSSGENASIGSNDPSALAILSVLCSAVLYSWNLVLQRQQALLAKPLDVALFQNIFVGSYLLPFAPWLITMPELHQFIPITGGALSAALALIFLSWGYARAEAQALLPLEYTGFAWAMLFGWFFFRETVEWPTLLGALLIIIGCWIATKSGIRSTAKPLNLEAQS